MKIKKHVEKFSEKFLDKAIEKLEQSEKRRFRAATERYFNKVSYLAIEAIQETGKYISNYPWQLGIFVGSSTIVTVISFSLLNESLSQLACCDLASKTQEISMATCFFLKKCQLVANLI